MKYLEELLACSHSEIAWTAMHSHARKQIEGGSVMSPFSPDLWVNKYLLCSGLKSTISSTLC